MKKHLSHLIKIIILHKAVFAIGFLILMLIPAYLIIRYYLRVREMNFRQGLNKIINLPIEDKRNIMLSLFGIVGIIWFTYGRLKALEVVSVFIAFSALFLFRKKILYPRVITGFVDRITQRKDNDGTLLIEKDKEISRYRFNNPNKIKSLIYGLSVTVIVVALFNLIMFNRFFPVVEGWWSFYAKDILNGKVPYRDFYLILPPLYPLQMALFHHLFGFEFINLRILGIIISVISAGYLYMIYSRIFPSYIATLVTIVSMFYQVSLIFWIPYDYNEVTELYLFVITYYFLRYSDSINIEKNLNKGNPVAINFIYLFIIGFLSSLIFLTKQSLGIFIYPACIFLLIIIGRKRGLKNGLTDAAAFSIGLLLPVIICFAWLYSNKALHLFFDQVFLKVDAKGSVFDLLWLWIPHLFNNWKRSMLLSELFVVLLILLFYRNYKNIFSLEGFEKEQFSNSKKSRPIVFIAILFLCLLAVYLPFIQFNFVKWFKIKVFFDGSLAISVVLTFLFGIVYFFKVLFPQKGNVNQRVYDVFIISTVASAFIFCTGTSHVVHHACLELSIGLAAGFLLLKMKNILWRGILTAGLVLLVAYICDEKYTSPYEWWGVEEPDIRQANVVSDIDLLHGFRLSSNTYNIIKETTSVIDKNTTDSDYIYTFPHIPLFYVLSNRYPPTFALVDWYDVTSGWVCDTDAARLLKFPPKVFVISKYDNDNDLLVHETEFNRGKFLEQRKIIDVLNGFMNDTAHYALVKKFNESKKCRLLVYKRI